MSSNSFGRYFTWSTFGESHGPAMGVLMDGCPSGVELDLNLVQKALDRRRPGQVDSSSGKVLVTDRNEEDQVEFLSGLYQGKTLGTPLMAVVKNKDQRSEDYKEITDQARVGHADDVWKQKFQHVDPRGGGRSSGRETLSRVIAGEVARQCLQLSQSSIKVMAFAESIGSHQITAEEKSQLDHLWQKTNSCVVTPVDEFSARFPSHREDIAAFLLQAKQEGESYGGVVELWIDGVPAGWGDPVFYKLKSTLASAMMSIGATCGVEFGEGFSLTRKKGTEVHQMKDSPVYGGLRGGISTGERIVLRVGFKPTSSITDVAKKGRHDPCIVPRAIPVVEAMAWALLFDHHLAL